MKIYFDRLALNCRKSIEEINLSAQISFFHGKISAGKSSIVRLIDFCLGGGLERTPAIMQELVSVSLYCRVANFEVVLDREAQSSNQVQVTWQGNGDESAKVLAPLHRSPDRGPIWGEDIYTLSDLIFFLWGVTPIKVRRSKREADSPLVRLSLRDLLFYCYLEQDHIDSSFFNMEDPYKKLKSRDVMRFVVGYYTERLNELDLAIEEMQEDRFAKLQAAEQLSATLQELGYGSALEIQAEIDQMRNQLRQARMEEQEIRSGQLKDEHLVDELRSKLRDLASGLETEEKAYEDQLRAIEELDRLKAEFISARFKLGRAEAASAVLSKADFQCCPLCGVLVQEMSPRAQSSCILCGTPEAQRKQVLASRAEALQKDLDSRIDDVTAALDRHRRASKKQFDVVQKIRRQKADLDRQLDLESQTYDSNFLARSREIERRIATREEQIRGLERMRRLPEMVRSLETAATRLQAEINALKKEMEEERGRLTQASGYVREVEQRFLEALTSVRVPGVGLEDVVRIDTKTWIPFVLPGGDEALRWNFDNAGSGGKKTLFKVCYALAVHAVAAHHDLPLPRFLIIDTPMKNIGEDVNEDLFRSFYSYLYEMAVGPLRSVQFVIVDKEYYAPEIKGIEVNERFMTPADPQHPPLISYYRGP
jgi:AAA domain-containing protein